MEKQSIGKIQVALGIILLVIGIILLIYVKSLYNNSGVSLSNFNTITPLNKTIPGFDNFSNESKSIISLTSKIGLFNIQLTSDSMFLTSFLSIIIVIILSIMLILEGLANISDGKR